MSLGPFWTRTNQTNFKVSVPYGTGFIDTTYPLLKSVHKHEKLMEEFVISWKEVLWGMI